MKAIFNKPVFSDDNFKHLNWFMTIVERSEYPVDLMRNLYQEGMLPDGLKDTTCEIRVTPEKILFYENINDEDEQLVAYTTLYRIDA